MPFFKKHQTHLLLIVYSLLFWCHCRLCNLAVWPESDEHLCQCAVGQQEHPWSAASPTGADHPRANRLVCQIRTPLVASLELWSICALEERSALLWTLSPPKSRPSCFVIRICTYILHSNNIFFSLCVLWMLWVVKYKSVCVYRSATFEPRFAPQCFILYFSIYRGYTLSFVSNISLNVVHQPVYIICIL